MAKWDSYTVKDVLANIQAKKLLLPIIQRELVWNEEKIKALFQTLCIGDSFGGIMTVRDMKGEGRKPLFDVRSFVPDYVSTNDYMSNEIEFSQSDIEYVVDGQQRLSAILMGVLGSYNGKKLYFNLFGDYANGEYVFEFAKAKEDLPKTWRDESDDTEHPTWWEPVTGLNARIADTPDVNELCDILLEDYGSEISAELKERVTRNIGRIHAALIADRCVGICEVALTRKQKSKDDETVRAENRLRVVNLFRKLNQGGTVLSGIELMRSVLKALSSENEVFLNKIKTQYEDIGLDQDGIIKYVFLLQDQTAKEITNITKDDSDFICNNQERIYASLDALRRFLEKSKLLDYVKKWRPSTVPLYLLAYYLYYRNESNDLLREFFDADVSSENVRAINKWLRLSFLNRVFQRGRGWNPDRTGRRLIHEILSKAKGGNFPVSQIFELYQKRLHWFDLEPMDDEMRLNSYDRAFVYYSIYGEGVLKRNNDADHIIAKHLLENAGLQADKINTISNYQLLFFRENRSKQDDDLSVWLDNVFKGDPDKILSFVKSHFIPEDKTLWTVKNYDRFIAERRKKIVEQLKTSLL